MVTAEKPAAEDPGTAVRSALPFDVYSRDCPARLVLGRLGDKWALLVLDRLDAGTLRFGTLRRSVAGISQKVLSQVLKNLERDGLVARTAFPTVPVTVEYALTPLGRTLTATVALLTHWAETHMPQIQAAQLAYDTRQAESRR